MRISQKLRPEIPNLFEIKHTTADFLSLQLNEVVEGEVSLWQFNSLLTFTTDTRSFPTLTMAKYATEQFHLAIQDWRIQGLSFKYIDETLLDNATFYIRFCPTNCGGTVAKAFFPVEAQSQVIIYAFAFQDDKINFMRNYLSHEIGHIYGLRHEFALTERGPSVQYGPNNCESVMNYNDHPPMIQETDRISVQELYDARKPIKKIGSQKLHVERLRPYGIG